ncbi:MAG: NADH-quinone oxidoreductase subunit N [Acidimicrobiia bacterium]|nr:NADH-quinone oxidoreductase subunit N [Acidimicrobiia bacterium]
METSFLPTAAEYLRLLPETILIVSGTILMILEGLAGPRNRKNLSPLAIAAILAAMAATVAAAGNPGPAFNNMILADGFGAFFRMVVLSAGLLAVLCSSSYLTREKADSGEYYALLLYSMTGQCLLSTANELIMVFIGLEISSIATYILAGYLRDDARNNESALKYFLLGSFATAFLLYGVAWIYGITGSTNLEEIRRTLLNPESGASPLLTGVAAALMFIGFAFKISAVPFQVWAPDVYQGAPAPVSAFMSAGPKAAAFAVMLRVYLTAFPSIGDGWQTMIWLTALGTMIVGNFAALTQSNLKRILAYSSIAHAGYVLVAVTAYSDTGTAAAMFYLAAYAFMNIGAFAVVSHFSRTGEKYVELNDLAGLAQKQPTTAALFSLFLFSLIGVPLTGGFFGKFYIFKAAIDSGLIGLTVLGLLSSAVAAFYYLRIIVVMYFHEPGDTMDTITSPAPGIQIALWTSALATLLLGVFPSFVLDYATTSAVLVR